MDYYNARSSLETTPEDCWEASADAPCYSSVLTAASKGLCYSMPPAFAFSVFQDAIQNSWLPSPELLQDWL